MDVSNTVGGGVFDPGKLNTHVDVHASGGVFDPGKLSALVLTTVDLEGVSSLRVDADTFNTLSLHSSLDYTGTGTYAGSISSSTGICEFICEAIFAGSANWKLILCTTSFAAIVSLVNISSSTGICEFICEAIFADSADWKLILCATSFAVIAVIVSSLSSSTGICEFICDAIFADSANWKLILCATNFAVIVSSLSSSTGICEFICEAIFADSANWKPILCATSFAAIASWVNMDLNVGLELGGSSKVYTDAKVVIDQTTCKRLSRGARWSTGRSVMMRYGIGAGAVGMLKCSRKSVII